MTRLFTMRVWAVWVESEQLQGGGARSHNGKWGGEQQEGSAGWDSRGAVSVGGLPPDW